MDTTTHADYTLDLGEKGCSRLLEDIEDALSKLAPGQTLLVIAHDPAAPLDIKAWSRRTGNPLVQFDMVAERYIIQKKTASQN